MNITELRTAVYNRTGYSSLDQVITTSVVEGYVNEALDFINSLRDWPWNQVIRSGTLTAGDDTITPNADDIRIMAVTVNNVPLRSVGLNEYLDFYDGSSTDVPRVYNWNSGGITLWPIPDRNYSYRYFATQREAPLTGATEPLMPEPFQWAIAEYAAYLVFRQTYQYEKAKEALDRFNQWFAGMVDNRRRTSSTIRTRVRNWWR